MSEIARLSQFTSVKIGGQAILISGAPGVGKTSLALALIDRGAILIGDDGVRLSRDRERLTASPPSETEGLVELRNVGLITVPTTSGKVALHLSLSTDAPRYLERAETKEIEGCSIPSIEFTLNGLTDCIRAEHALKVYGLPG